MPGPYSSRGSIDDARELASNLKIRFELLSINEIYEAARQTLAPVFAGMPQDVTEENIQSRARGLLLMSLSNKFGALVLSTGNKSELAVGYCTLYGDMVGGLAVISDVPKTLVYRLSAYVNSRRKVIPQATIEKPPSAELRPDQKDSDSLPPYEVLDPILEDYVEESCSAEQIARVHNFDPGSGAAGDPHGRAQRIQAATSGARNQDLRQGVRLWEEIPNRSQVGALTP
jgi:NAD+ synthase (glutamine-hydrolysing)